MILTFDQNSFVEYATFSAGIEVFTGLMLGSRLRGGVFCGCVTFFVVVLRGTLSLI